MLSDRLIFSCGDINDKMKKGEKMSRSNKKENRDALKPVNTQKKMSKAEIAAREEEAKRAMKAARAESEAKAKAVKQAAKDAKVARAARKKAKETEEELSNRSLHVDRQVHRIGLLISITMGVAALVLLGTAIYMVSLANADLTSGSVNHVTLSRINQVVASVLLLMVTGLTALLFFRLYLKKSPFTRSNITIVRVVAVMLMLLSVLPVAVQWVVGLFLNIDVGWNVNLIYIFIGVVFYCISYIFEQGDIMKKQDEEKMDLQKNILLHYAEVSENKSGQVSQHVQRMAEYCRVLAKHMGMTEHEVEVISTASIMHDIGKIMIPPEILMKDASLSDEEYAIMKTHVVAGSELLLEGKGEVMEEASRISLDHHENWDGSGYLGKKGNEIDIGAQLVAVANLFDSLVSARSYKKGWELNKVYSTIIDENGKKFGPEVVSAFMKAYKEMMEIYNTYNKTISYDWEPPANIVESYDAILGEFSPRRKPVEEVVDEDAYKNNVELDLRRLI